MKVGQPASSMEVWDPATYPGKIVEIIEEPAESSKYGKARLKFVIRANNEDGETSDLWYWTNMTLSNHKLATFRPLVRAVMPDLNLDDPALVVDTDDLVGKRCRVILGIDEERGRNVVEKVLPAEGRRVGKPAPEPAEADRVAVPF
jgi:hypothetical protein